VLLVLSCSTFSASIYRERKENNDFIQFHDYLKAEIQPQDIFIFHDKLNHMPNIIAYLFPGHYQVAFNDPILGTQSQLTFDRTVIDFTDLADNGRFQGRRAWIIAMSDGQCKPAFVIPPESDAEFRGVFGWGFYRFRIYCTESPAKWTAAIFHALPQSAK
jgi:hypothetical protein